MTAPRTLTQSPVVRAVELMSVFTFFACELGLIWRLYGRIELSLVEGALVLFGSYLLADFISGLFHWAGDTWGSPTMPVLGGLFVRPFREHHVDPQSIVRHDFIEVTGANCAISLPWFLVHFLPLETSSRGTMIAVAFLGLFLFWIFSTAFSHRWAHADAPPRAAVWLQKARLILPKAHHDVHHVRPHVEHYCITVGWMNPVLDKLGFFRGAERVISALTGLVPREDDLYPEVAPSPNEDLELAQAERERL